MPANRGKSPRRPTMEAQSRRTAVANDLDVAPEDLLRVAGTERFHPRFLCCKPPGKVNRGLASTPAVRNFAIGEHPPQEPLAIPLNGGGDARDFGRVKSQANDVGHHDRQCGQSPTTGSASRRRQDKKTGK